MSDNMSLILQASHSKKNNDIYKNIHVPSKKENAFFILKMCIFLGILASILTTFTAQDTTQSLSPYFKSIGIVDKIIPHNKLKTKEPDIFGYIITYQVNGTKYTAYLLQKGTPKISENNRIPLLIHKHNHSMVRIYETNDFIELYVKIMALILFIAFICFFKKSNSKVINIQHL